MFYFKNCKKIQIQFKNTVRINLIHSTIRTTIFKLFFVTVDNLTETNHVIGCRNHIGDTLKTIKDLRKFSRVISSMSQDRDMLQTLTFLHIWKLTNWPYKERICDILQCWEILTKNKCILQFVIGVGECGHFIMPRRLCIRVTLKIKDQEFH